MENFPVLQCWQLIQLFRAAPHTVRSVGFAFGHQGCWCQPGQKWSLGKDSLGRAVTSSPCWALRKQLKSGVSKKGGGSASLSWLYHPWKERKQGLATLHQKQKRILHYEDGVHIKAYCSLKRSFIHLTNMSNIFRKHKHGGGKDKSLHPGERF